MSTGSEGDQIWARRKQGALGSAPRPLRWLCKLDRRHVTTCFINPHHNTYLSVRHRQSIGTHSITSPEQLPYFCWRSCCFDSSPSCARARWSFSPDRFDRDTPAGTRRKLCVLGRHSSLHLRPPRKTDSFLFFFRENLLFLLYLIEFHHEFLDCARPRRLRGGSLSSEL